jgi:hypothetical protein
MRRCDARLLQARMRSLVAFKRRQRSVAAGSTAAPAPPAASAAAVLSLLRTSGGLTQRQVDTVLERDPLLLSYDPETEVAPRLAQLRYLHANARLTGKNRRRGAHSTLFAASSTWTFSSLMTFNWRTAPETRRQPRETGPVHTDNNNSTPRAPKHRTCSSVYGCSGSEMFWRCSYTSVASNNSRRSSSSSAGSGRGCRAPLLRNTTGAGLSTRMLPPSMGRQVSAQECLSRVDGVGKECARASKCC